ncbi:MAG: dUTP diphosphatase [Bacteroidales bacterium]|nr:dUTP diphosphatase [Bacteroidales bacterium]
MIVKIVNQSPYPLPKYATALSAGMDLNANIENPIELHSLERAIVPTGLFIELPQGYEAQIRPRSGLAAKFGVTVANAPGTIDADYRGEIKVILVNLSKETFVIKPGERIAQMVIAKYSQIQWQQVEKLSETLRGEGGFGSTGLGVNANNISASKICGKDGKPDMFKLYALYQKTSGLCTDTRKIKEGCLFLALKGENFDGNDFLIQALEGGAAYVISDNKQKAAPAKKQFPKKVIVVDNCLRTLQQLARHHRLQFKIPVVGLTGTNGKTTTKELINAVLSTRYKVVATEGNLNNDIGVPLTLLRIDKDTEVAVVEMGASHPEDIATLASLVCPSFGLITSIGKAHLQGFGSLEGVMKAKGKLYDNLQEHHKIAFLNTDNPLLVKMASQRPEMQIVPYGITSNSAKLIPPTDKDPFLKLEIADPSGSHSGKMVKIKTNLIGSYNADNILAAICIGTYFAVPTSEAVKAISLYTPSNNRSQMTKTRHNVLIKDTYNANPTSMKASLESFATLQLSSRKMSKVMLLGDMRELGGESQKEHRNILDIALKLLPEKLLLVGEEFAKAYKDLYDKNAECIRVSRGKTDVQLFKDTETLNRWLEDNPLKNKAILIKGSHSIGLEKTFPLL